ncbi:MAG: hypothetical protein LBU70_10610 [Chitinispirillales bacterium]|jgi:hypothetical protein|nr:hypothetical protein [Chitinispirillales bacterium]
MLNVLVVNKNADEGNIWRDRLVKEGFRGTILPECVDFSDMVNVLMRERVHIVLFSATLIDNKTASFLKPLINYFLRTKIVIIGNSEAKDASLFLLLKHTDVIRAKDFDSALNDYCKQVQTAPAAKVDGEKSREQAAKTLLGDHFLSQEAAAILLGQTFKCTPGYAVIGIHTDSFYNEVHRALAREVLERELMCVLHYSLGEFYAIVDDSPPDQLTMKLANSIRNRLFEETDAMFSIGVSRMRDRAGELYACRKEAARACRATHMFGYNSVIHIDYLSPNDIEYVYPKHKEQKLIEATLDGDTGCAFRMLDDIFEILKSSKELKQELINRIALSITVSLNTAATSRMFAFGKIKFDSLSLSKLLSATSIGEAYDHLKKGIENFAKEMDAVTEVSRDALFYKLQDVKKAEKSISIFNLSQTLATTPTFVNTAINRNSGEDIFSFFENGCVV